MVEIAMLTHHVYHAIHHVLSATKPRFVPIFCKIPRKNTVRKKLLQTRG
jgi:hypothetical protein